MSSRPTSQRKAAFAPQVFVSGGETGADSIPFSVSKDLGVGLKGFMHIGFRRSDGKGREVAARYGLEEGQGGHKWRDMRNAESADACVAFLTTQEQTGRGTMKTVQYFVSGRYKHVHLDKPEHQDHLVLGSGDKPVIVFWDIAEAKLHSFSSQLCAFLVEHHPRALMLAGPLERTWPGIERLGAQLLHCALVLDKVPLDDMKLTEEVEETSAGSNSLNSTASDVSANVEPNLAQDQSLPADATMPVPELDRRRQKVLLQSMQGIATPDFLQRTGLLGLSGNALARLSRSQVERIWRRFCDDEALRLGVSPLVLLSTTPSAADRPRRWGPPGKATV
mmetsp:Transcript_27428/g.78808  ORF Transcript_27428/g.78808 Transcript_27428/m.78808 type:complete len:335 (-) Transcript_27428:22-1026(-)